MTPFTLPLGRQVADVADAGGKGANLAALVRAGFPVPDGFIVSTSAYRLFVEINDLQTEIIERSSAIAAGDMAAFERASTAIRKRFAKRTMPAEVAQAILSAATALQDGPVAVRSSATAEDLPDASFAGQQDTYLNVRGEGALLDAVQRCWSSLWTARAIAYRAQQEIPSADVSLAVVVQEMVPAVASGVLFTVNPINGKTDEMVVNATWGLGEALVAGQVTPDTLVVDKASGKIRQVAIGDKKVMTAATAEGTEEIEVAQEQRARQSVSADQVAELARLALSIELHFGTPQDIEWAIADGTAHILQSRPVTALPTTSSSTEAPGDDAWPPSFDGDAQPFDQWTQMDVGERWPEPVTPLTWSVWLPVTQENMARSDTIAALKEPYVEQIQWARRVFGRVYFNEGAMAHILSDGYGMPASIMAATMGGQAEVAPEQDRWQWSKLLRRGPRLAWTSLRWEGRIKAFEKRFTQIDRWVDDFMQTDAGHLSDNEIWQAAQGPWRARLMDAMDDHVIVTSSSSTSFGMVESLCGRWLQDKQVTYTLITGLTGVIAAEMVPALWQMARTLGDLGLDRIVLEHDPVDALARLRAEPSAEPFLHLLDGFLLRHGHRCMIEAELLHPRWAEAPELVLGSVASYLRVGTEQDQSAAEARQRAEREEATRRAQEKLGLFRRRFFLSSLERAQRLVRLRDNGQHYLVKLLLPIRRLYATLAERWAERDWLRAPDDFFFLVIPEIEAVLKAGDPAGTGLDLKHITSERRTAYDHWFGVAIPEVLDADGRPVIADADAADRDVLPGVAASAGQITGVARVIRQARDAVNLEPGQILVTRATDPGWTPVFSVIGGLVLEVGGQLSHGAIVAREYGLPAVLNVPDATRRIEDGQTITVDGSAGRVSIAPPVQ